MKIFKKVIIGIVIVFVGLILIGILNPVDYYVKGIEQYKEGDLQKAYKTLSKVKNTDKSYDSSLILLSEIKILLDSIENKKLSEIKTEEDIVAINGSNEDEEINIENTPTSIDLIVGIWRMKNSIYGEFKTTYTEMYEKKGDDVWYETFQDDGIIITQSMSDNIKKGIGKKFETEKTYSFLDDMTLEITEKIISPTDQSLTDTYVYNIIQLDNDNLITDLSQH